MSNKFAKVIALQVWSGKRASSISSSQLSTASIVTLRLLNEVLRVLGFQLVYANSLIACRAEPCLALTLIYQLIVQMVSRGQSFLSSLRASILSYA